MPRWASRILLEITGVRVERVQEIGLADCLAEGIRGHSPEGLGKSQGEIWSEYGQLWDSLNSKRGYSVESNPWCWVLSFKNVKP